MLQCSAPCNKLYIPILALTTLLGPIHGGRKAIYSRFGVQRGSPSLSGNGDNQPAIVEAVHLHAGRHLAVIEHQRTQHVAGLQVQRLG